MNRKPAPAPRVLVVDDNRDAVLMLELLLRDEGYDVTTAYSGDEALDKVRSGDYDVLILDIKMPGKSGYDVARSVRRDPERAAAVLIGVSGHYKKGSDKVLAELVGFDHFLAKPYDPAMMLSLLAPLRERRGAPRS